jgi:neutral ceramidase
MEATHADVAPAIRPGLAGYLEAERIGRAIGEHGAALFDSLEGSLTDDVTLGAGLREIEFGLGFEAAAIDGHVLAPPSIGAAQVAGAKENLTPVLGWLPPFRAGLPKPFANRGPQGPKWQLLSDRRQKRILPKADFPTVFPLQVLRIGATLLVGAPFEITAESGRRVRDAAPAAAAAGGIDDVVVSSVANEYWGYCTTPEEYELQYYEGGHTLHGPHTQPWLAAQAARLAGAVSAGEQVHDVATRTFRLPSKRYLPRPTGARVPRRADGAAAFADPTRTDDGYWEQRWHDVGPADLHWHEPLARVEREDCEVIADDQDGRVAVLLVRPGLYAARWYGPPLGRGPRHRFVLTANAGQPEERTELFG